MARFSRIEVALKMHEIGMIPVFYHGEIETAKLVLQACYDGGARVFEFTNRGDFAHIVFEQLSKWVQISLPDMILGVGSIIDPSTASLYIQLGANFIVSPILNPEIAKVCNRRKILWSAGCGTLSEISYAEELGAEIVKIFPGSSVGGADFVAAIKGPFPWSSLMPTGGVDPTKENLSKWFTAGVACVGMGSNLIPKKSVQEGDWATIEDNCRRVYDIISKLIK